jgi:chromosomal replication initiation ATPase DnaA
VEAWQQVLGALEREVPREQFSIWLKHTALLAIDDDEAVVATPNLVVRQEVETHYQVILEAALHRVFDRRLTVLLVIESTL